MTAVLGYFVCLAILLPALSLDVFFGLLSKTNRQHEVLALIRSVVQILVTVTSPLRLGLTLAVLLCAYALESDWPKRGGALFVVCVVALGSILHVATLNQVDLSAATVLLPSALITVASFSWGSRLEGSEERCASTSCLDCGTGTA